MRKILQKSFENVENQLSVKQTLKRILIETEKKEIYFFIILFKLLFVIFYFLTLSSSEFLSISLVFTLFLRIEPNERESIFFVILFFFIQLNFCTHFSMKKSS